MADTLWADVSQFQRVVDDSYPHPLFAFRSNDGNYRDANFGANRAWADGAIARGKILGYIVYYFYRPGVDAAAVLRQMVGTPNPKMAVMIDLESDGGKVSGNQSAALNGQVAALSAWLGSPAKVIGYGNTSDLNNLWPQKPPGIRLVVASYGANPSYPGKFAHQYADNVACPPFGPCDANSADGMAPNDVAAMLGLGGAPAPAPPPPAPPPPAPPSVLQQGATGPAVTALQTKLNQLGAHVATDGNFGPATRAAVVAFQQSHALAADGIVGPLTERAIDAAIAAPPAPPPPPPKPAFPGITRLNSRGPAVTALQNRLNQLGYRLAPDGIFGPQTAAAVRDFQTKHHLIVDAVAGPATWAALWS